MVSSHDQSLVAFKRFTREGSKDMDFQAIVLEWNRFWAKQGCVIWQPHNEKVGAGTANPGTALRVLGPEHWYVAYIEPSSRPADGRYGDNPNRWQEYYQYQVILKPAPANNIQLFLDSLRAVGIDIAAHDLRFVEDNWQSEPIRAWGRGWEVWLDGLEIAQYTYFQQVAGQELDPVSLEITYGIERIAMALQKAKSIPEIKWIGDLFYGDLHLADEIDYCRYNFEHARVDRLQQMYDLFEAEAQSALEHGLVLPAHDYLLRCSHTFNVMDARRAIGVTQRAAYFSRMGELSQRIGIAYLAQRSALGYPLTRRSTALPTGETKQSLADQSNSASAANEPADLVLEIGTEELPTQDLQLALKQLEEVMPSYLKESRLAYGNIDVLGTPRRLVVLVYKLAPRQTTIHRVVKGPPASTAFDQNFRPTSAGAGFAKSLGVRPETLEIREFDGKQYAAAMIADSIKTAREVLGEMVPKLLSNLRFPISMRWNASQVRFSRPIRWILALLGEGVVPITYAGVESDRYSHGTRPMGDPQLKVASSDDYLPILAANKVMVAAADRRVEIKQRADELAEEVGGYVPDDPSLLDEVAGLVEYPWAFRGSFNSEFLSLPTEVLITVMKKHQRYFPIMENARLMPYFIAMANGDLGDIDVIRSGNEEVLRARFEDARFFYQSDIAQPLSEFLPRLSGLLFHEELGSYFEKTCRIKALIPTLAAPLRLSPEEHNLAMRAAELAKADLASSVVMEFSSLEGTMGRHYARRAGEDLQTAIAIEEHYLPRYPGDSLPTTILGVVLGLADRLDTLTGLCAVGMTPSGTADPYALRRTALGMIEILCGWDISLDLNALIRNVAAGFPAAIKEEQVSEVAAFVRGRLRRWLIDRKLRSDIVEAVLAEVPDDPARAEKTARGLDRWAQQEDFATFMQAHLRMSRILRGVDGVLPLTVEKMTEPAEITLYSQYMAVRDAITGRTKIEDATQALTTLVAPVNAFFNGVLVMHEDDSVKETRLALLQRLVDLPRGIFDPSRISAK